MVYKSILKLLKKAFIPFAAISTSSLFLTFKQTFAETKTIGEWLYERGSVKNSPFYKGNLQTESMLEHVQQSLEEWKQIGEFLVKGVDWFNHLPENIVQLTINLTTWIYIILSKLILVTPSWLFTNASIIDTTIVFSFISVVAVIVLTVIESLKKMYNNQKIRFTEFQQIIKRFPIAVAGAGFAPLLFEYTFKILNKLSTAISKIGQTEIIGNKVTTFDWSGINLIVMIGFDIILLSLLFPIFLKNGRRWFDLICLSTLTPLALSAWIFDSYRHLFDKWWKNIKQLSLVQLSYSIYVCILGIIIFGTRGLYEEDIWSLFIKLCIMAGGLWRLANPPSIMLSYTDHGKDVWSIYKEVKNALTFKKYTPFVFAKEVKGEINEFKNKIQEKRSNKILEERRSTGRRYNK
jgi:hypothetical protein